MIPSPATPKETRVRREPEQENRASQGGGINPHGMSSLGPVCPDEAAKVYPGRLASIPGVVQTTGPELAGITTELIGDAMAEPLTNLAKAIEGSGYTLRIDLSVRVSVESSPKSPLNDVAAIPTQAFWPSAFHQPDGLESLPLPEGKNHMNDLKIFTLLPWAWASEREACSLNKAMTSILKRSQKEKLRVFISTERSQHNNVRCRLEKLFTRHFRLKNGESQELLLRGIDGRRFVGLTHPLGIRAWHVAVEFLAKEGGPGPWALGWPTGLTPPS